MMEDEYLARAHKQALGGVVVALCVAIVAAIIVMNVT